MKNQILLLVGLVIASRYAGAENWKYAIEENLTDVQGVHAVRFKEIIEANSSHTVQIFPLGTLGEPSQVAELAQAGVLQFVNQSLAISGSFIPEAQVLSVPYMLPENEREVNYFFENSVTINRIFPRIYATHGLQLLKIFPGGKIFVATQTEFRSPQDLAGVKVRVMTSPLLVETYKAFGAVPTPLPWGEVFGALQTGLVQGQENPMYWIESTKTYEVTEVITDIGHTTYTVSAMANKPFYDGLSDTDKKLVQQASAEAHDYILKHQFDLTEASKVTIMKKKPRMKFIALTEEERKPFRKAAEQVRARFINMTGDSGKAILKQLEADLQAAKNNSIESDST